MNFPYQFFVSGTGTGVGKTVISAMLVAGLGYDYWKPIQTGVNTEQSDSDWLRQKGGIDDARIHPEYCVFGEPLSPHAAAALEGKQIDFSKLTLPTDRPLVVEGAGGLLVPINDKGMMTDLIRHLALPVVLVVDSGLGTINHTLLSIRELSRQGIELCGIIMNGPKNPGNRHAIEFYGDVTVIAEVEEMPSPGPEALLDAFGRALPDWGKN